MNKKEYRDKWKRENPIYIKLYKVMYRRVYKFRKKHGVGIEIMISEMVGCSFKELKSYLESKWVNGMNWENYGEWEIDHIIPLSKDDTREGFIRLNHYSNLQPLWKEDNRRKGKNTL